MTLLLGVSTAIRVDTKDKNDSEALKKHGKRGLVNLAYGHHQHAHEEIQPSAIYGPPVHAAAPIHEVPHQFSHGNPEPAIPHDHYFHYHHPEQFISHPIGE